MAGLIDPTTEGLTVGAPPDKARGKESMRKRDALVIFTRSHYLEHPTHDWVLAYDASDEADFLNEIGDLKVRQSQRTKLGNKAQNEKRGLMRAVVRAEDASRFSVEVRHYSVWIRYDAPTEEQRPSHWKRKA